MGMLVIDVEGSRQPVIGMLSRRMLEIRPGLFVGALSRREVEQIWEVIIQDRPKAALLVHGSRNELGFEIKTAGEHRYIPHEFDGLTLVSFMGKPKETKR